MSKATTCEQRAPALLAELELLRGLQSKAELSALLGTPAMVEGVVELIWEEVEMIQAVGAATTDELQSKFQGAIEMSYSGLDTFFGGLEGVIGPPHPKLFEGMEREHLREPGSESTSHAVEGCNVTSVTDGDGLPTRQCD